MDYDVLAICMLWGAIASLLSHLGVCLVLAGYK